MYIALGFAGIVLLIAIIWCVKLMRNGFTSLSRSQDNIRSRFRDGELRLAKEQLEIPPTEQIALLEAAVQDLLKLDGIIADCTRNGNDIHVTTPQGSWMLSYQAYEDLGQMPRHHGYMHWTLRTEDTTTQYTTIDHLMRAFEALLQGSLPETPQNSSTYHSRQRIFRLIDQQDPNKPVHQAAQNSGLSP